MKGKDLHRGIVGAWDVRGGVCPEGRRVPWWVSPKRTKRGEGILQGRESLQNVPSALLHEHWEGRIYSSIQNLNFFSDIEVAPRAEM